MNQNKHNPAKEIQDLQFFGEFGGVNPSISDSATFSFLKAKTMLDTFEGNAEGCYLYSRHTSPSNHYLSMALAKMENTEAANVAGSGMGAITPVILQIANAGDHIVSSRTIYGGSYAFLKNWTPKFNIETTFVDITNLEKIEAAIKPNTKMIYAETLSNPLLELADVEALSKIAKKHNIKLVIDNTFTPLIFSPANMGADVVVYSLTKFINGTNDMVGGAICASAEFINDLKSVIDGSSMLLGPVMDSLRSAQVLKNMRTLPIRMIKHSENAQYIAEHLEKDGLAVKYPGLKSHPQHDLYTKMMNPEFGYGGMITLDLKNHDMATKFMEVLQEKNVGYLAVSLGFYKTLFNAPGTGTSSEVPEEEQEEMGLSTGLIRMSLGLDFNIEDTYKKMKDALNEIGYFKMQTQNN
jgi:methionine-gamma-lyase